ncbi:hypothetical protein ERUR111494_00150 [Erysipelothrix urinaevulpis]|uniref:hypothetical protein n=1 Tax=Erysipelothrix urinaevulpis TaxID=2683717 RepID=UPI00135CE020|nr:hypothetical protein [Erysipelothrix urinaevulpis]
MKKFKILIIVNLLVLGVLAFSLLSVNSRKKDNETPWTASSVSKDPVMTAKTQGSSRTP